MGSSASYNLARRGLKVLTLERFGLNHDRGSSHGRTRIIRLAYFEDPRYVPLLRRAFVAWDQLEKDSGASIIRRTGGLMIGREEGDLVRGVVRSAKEHSLPHRLLGARETMEVFGALRIDDGFVSVHEENAGILFPDNCIAAYAKLAEEAGGSLHLFEQVTGWKRTSEGLEVATGKERYSTDKLVFAAGAWTGKLLQGLLPLTCERQVQFWFRAPEEGSFSAGNAPIFIMEEDGSSYYYGIPDLGHGAKVAKSHGGVTADPDGEDRQVTESDLGPVRDFMARRLPSVDRRPIEAATCLYTNTPDENFVIDFHPDDEDVLVLSACSGHGFKFSSVVGELAADLLTRGRSEFDISFFRMGRFRNG
jgi:sarcosine oxidase